ncbi:MAG: hypothetical protein Q7R78_02665 [bacterium]|nr:hypothetical protein [bacterium]
MNIKQNHKIEESELKTIRDNRISPRPKWLFTLYQTIFWTVFSFLILMSGLALGIVFHTFKKYDYEIIILPSLWALASVLIALLARMAFRKIRNTYRYGEKPLIFVVLACALLALFFYLLNITEYIEDRANNEIPIYNKIESRYKPTKIGREILNNLKTTTQ